MSTDRWRDLARSGVDCEQRFRSRFDLSRAAVALLGVALVALALASTVLAKVSEDVLGRDGLEVSDASNLQLVTDHRSAWMVDVARWVTQIGSIGLLAVIAVVAGVLLWRLGARLAVAVAPLLSLLVAGAVASVVKQLVGRARPPLGLRLVAESEPSFPSGHSTDSAALFIALGIVVAVVVLRRPLARVLSVGAGVAAAALVGASRLVLGVHWPTDVLAGWALGTVVAIVVTTAILVLTRATHPVDPVGGARRRLVGRTLQLMAWRRPSPHRAVAS